MTAHQKMTPGPAVTVFTSDNKPLAKRFWLKDGRIEKQAVANLYAGAAETVTAATAAELESLLCSLTQKQAIASGILSGRARARITTRQGAAPGAATRTKGHFHYPEAPGWLLWDYDDKTMSDRVRERVKDLGGPLEALFHIWPEARHGAYLIRQSSSDGVTAPGCETIASAGRHGFFRIADVSRSREILDTLQCRAWAAGLAWIALSKSGAMLPRSIVDTAVGSPERLIFEAPPILQAPVMREARAALVHEAPHDLDAPQIEAGTKQAAEAAELAARREIKPEAEAAERQFVEDRAAAEAARTGAHIDVARLTVRQMLRGATLSDNTLLQMPNGEWVTVGHILDRIEEYDRKGIPDPIEGLPYGPDKATLLLRPRAGRDEKPRLVSHAHGLRTVYRFERFERPTEPPFHTKPTGRKERHGQIIRNALKRAVQIIRAQKEVKRRQDEASDDSLPRQEQARIKHKIRKDVQRERGLDFLPASRPTDTQPCPRIMLSGAQGTGKTLAAAEGLARSRGVVSLVLQPDHKKVGEFVEEYHEAAGKDPTAPEVFPLHGRGADDPETPGEKMCRVHKTAAKIAERGLSPKQVLCPVCPMREVCGHMRQEARLKRLAEQPSGVVIVAPSEYGFLDLPGNVKPDLVIWDEAPKNLGAARAVISFETLGEPLTYEQGGRAYTKEQEAGRMVDALEINLRLLRPLRIALRDAYQTAPNNALAFLREKNVTPLMIREALAALSDFEDRAIKAKAAQAFEAARFAEVHQRRKVDLDARLEKVIEEHDDKAVKAFRLVLEALLPELESGRDCPNAVIRCEDINAGTAAKGKVKGIEANYLQRPAFPENIPFLHLDGTGEHALAQAVFGPMENASERVERNTYVTQVTGRNWSKQSITGKGLRTPEKIAEAAELRRALIAFCHSKPDALVIAPLEVIEALKTDGLQNPTAHFGALRGRNEWAGFETAIIIGREEPTEAVERIARAFCAASPEPFQSLRREDGTFARWHKEQRGLRMRDGSPQAIEVNRHPDPWGDRVLRQLRDGELCQGIDRLRPHYKPEPVNVFLLSAVALDVTVDRVERWIDLKKGGNRPQQAIDTAGVLPLSESEAARIFPGIWAARQTAQEDLPAWRNRVAVLTADFPNNIYYSDFRQLSGAVLVEYHPAPRTPGGRAGRRHRALVWARPEDARAKLEAVAGELRECALVPGWIEAMDAWDAWTEREAMQAAAEAPDMAEEQQGTDGQRNADIRPPEPDRDAMQNQTVTGPAQPLRRLARAGPS